MPVSRSKIGVFVAGLVLALSLPGLAFAANTAVFTGAAPAPGSSSTVTKPTVSVIVFDTNGVSSTSSNFSLYVDGIKRAVKMTRLSGWGLRKFKLSFTLTSDLSIGNHPVVVNIRDLKHKNSRYTWSFNVLDGIAPSTTSDVQLNYVGPAIITLTAHDNVPGTIQTRYMLDGGSSTLYTAPIVVPAVAANAQHSLEFWSVDAAGNVEAHHLVFFLQQKFGSAAEAFADAHSLPTSPANAVCMSPACHGTDPRTHTPTDLATIHIYPMPGGTFVAPGCAACHAGTAVASDNCAAVACHGPNGPHGTTHIAISTDTTSPAACTASTCHGTDAMATHTGGCVQCHSSTNPVVIAAIAAGMAPSPVFAKCETCHLDGFAAIHAPGDVFHEVTASILPNPSCVTPVCHNFTDVTAIHAQDFTGVGAPAAPGCRACHIPGQAPPSTTRCLSCHPTGILEHRHPVIPAAHITTNTCASGNVAGCHQSDVSTIHTTTLPGGPAAPGCIACHDVGVTPTTDCANVNCHPGGLSVHNTATVALANASHNASGTVGSGCFLSGCHLASMDIAQIHASWINPPGCAACHTTLRPAAVNCTACHPDVHGAIQTAAHSSLMASGCTGLGCHAVQAGVVSPTGTALLDVEHDNWGVTCLDCHASTDLRVGNAVTNHLNNCDACHSGTGSNPNLNGNYHGFEFMNPANASGHNIAGNTIGAKTRFDGSQGITLKWQATETTTLAGFADGRNGTYVTGQVATMTTAWDFPTVNVFWSSTDASAPVTATKGLTATSTVTCSGTNGCHDPAGIQASGPHGSTQTWALDPNYPGDYTYAELTKYVTANTAYSSMNAAATQTVVLDASRYYVPLSTSGIAMFPGAATHAAITSASVASTLTVPGWVPNVTALGNRTDGTQGPTAVICAKCHDLENFNALSGVVEGSNTAHDSHHQDQLDGSAQCVNCHIGIPHGWKRPRLLVDTDTDVAPYKSAGLVGVTRGTVGANGFNGIGMQALSGVNDHTLGTGPNGAQPYDTGTGLATAVLNPGHIGMAYWSEPQCDACGFHTGETPAQLVNTP